MALIVRSIVSDRSQMATWKMRIAATVGHRISTDQVFTVLQRDCIS